MKIDSVNRHIINDLWNKSGSVKNTNIVFHIIKSTHTKIQKECKVLKFLMDYFLSHTTL